MAAPAEPHPPDTEPHPALRRRHHASIQPWFTLALLAGDAACVTSGLLLAYTYRFHFDRIPVPGVEPPSFGAYLAAIPVTVALMFVGIGVTRGYAQTAGRAFLDEVYGLVGGVGVGSVLLLAVMSVYRAFSYSRLVVLYLGIATFVLLVVFRFVMRRVLALLRRRGLGTTRALVVGSGGAADLVINRLRMWPQYGYELVGVVDDLVPTGEEYHTLPVLGPLASLARQIRRHDVRTVFLALPQSDNRRLLRVLAECEGTGAEFKIVPSLLEVMTSGVVADDIDGIPLVGVRQSRLVGANLVLKRLFDFVVTALLLIPGLPVMLAIAAIVKLDSPGPALYRQERVGRLGRAFTAYKFRSMVVNAEEQTGPVFASRDDPRVTRIGRFLRRTGLDEAPQVVNVFRGEMSLVGPRPERPHFVAQFESEVPGYVRRHEVLPGITGWAQLNDLRQDTPIEQRTIYDSYYVENWSLLFDVRILIATFFRIFFHRNAY